MNCGEFGFDWFLILCFCVCFWFLGGGFMK